MKAFLILEDGTVFEGTSIGSRELSVLANTSMTGYLEVMTDHLCRTGSCHDLSTDWKLWNHTGCRVKTSMGGRIYCQGVIQNAKQFPLRRNDTGLFERK